MKILFLDLDGVMVPVFGCKGNDLAISKNNQWDVEPFSKLAVKILNEIIEKTDCEIILSSDWRDHFTLPEIQDIFFANSVNKAPIGFTGNSKLYTADKLEIGREAEIREYINTHDIKQWCAVDDLNLSGLGNRFIHCKSPQMGIKQCSLKEKIISILNREA